MSSTKVLLRSSDGESFEIDEIVAYVSETIKNIIDDGCYDGVIPIPNVYSKTLIKVIEYCKKHVEDNGKEYDKESKKEKIEERKRWEANYMDIDQEVLYHLMIAANYLEIKGLLHLTVEKAANMIRGKTPEQIREIFNIKNDFTPEEEEQIRKENVWAFD
ncbi:hypothetical protein NE237_001140 [Protea cynaroides]|uniref:SKP1-like protein n=1 Tax=Protea cynaroides TaxID=273540 RepID=A0A9Q0QY51_9MAGN|nr:hypothetical protein NE237_001140 [Protea cynaroides]